MITVFLTGKEKANKRAEGYFGAGYFPRQFLKPINAESVLEKLKSMGVKYVVVRERNENA